MRFWHSWTSTEDAETDNSTYRIQDESTPGGLARYAVDPLWPLLGVMLGGVWLSWSWFLFNGVAVGSPTQRQELWWVTGGLAGALLISLALIWAEAIDVLRTQAEFAYAGLVLTVWKLGVTYLLYLLYLLQSRTIQIYEYYGGQLRSGMLVLVAAVFLVEPMIRRAQLPAFVHMMLG